MSNKPVEIEIILRESIVKGIKEAQAAFKELDSSAKTSTINFKAQINEQRQAIKQIESDIKNMIAERDKLASTQAKSNANVEIAAARRALAEEKDLLIKTQTSAAAANKAEEASQGGIIASLGKWALGLATVAGAMKIGKAIIESTEGTAHRFEQVTTAAASATNFFFKAIASGDWSNFWEGMDKAITGAIKYVDELEKIDNLKNENLIKSAESRTKVGELRAESYETTDPKKLKGIYTELIAEQKKDFDRGKDLREKEKNLLLDKAETDNKVSKDIIENFVRESSSLENVIELGKKYKELAGVKLITPTQGAYGMSTTGNLEQYNAAQKELAQLGEKGKKAAAYADQIAKIPKELRKQIAETIAADELAKGAFNQSNRRDKEKLKNIGKKEEEDAKAAAKKAKEDAELDNRIKATQELMKTANDADRDAIAKRLVLLEKEKQLIEWKNQAAKAIYENKPMEARGAVSVVGGIRDMAKALGVDLDKNYEKNNALEVDKLKKGTRDKEAEGAKRRKKYHLEEKQEVKELGKEWYGVADAADALAQAIGNSNSELAGLLNGVGLMANQLGNLARAGAFTKEGMSKGDAISAAVSGATQLIGIVAGAAASRKKVMDEYYSSIISQQHQYNLLLNEQLRLNSDVNGSLFLKDYEGRLKSSTEAYNNAQQKYQDEFKKFATAEAITGKKNVVSGQNVLGGIGAGAAMGAGIGSIVPVVGTVIGAAAGALIGGLAGLFAKKKKDITAPLLETYPKLIKATGEFDEALAKTLITNKQVTEATAATLQKLIDWKEAAQKARDQLSQVITDLAGSMGDDLRNALVTAFQDGTDASKAFGDSVNKTLSNILSNMIFNRVFEGAFKELDKGMKASYGIGEDGKPISGAVVDNSWVDDFKKFMDQKGALTDQFNKAMAEFKQVGAQSGLDLFGKSSGSSAKGMTADIKAITEETGSVLAGGVNSISLKISRLLESDTNSMTMLQKSLEYQQRTADNTEDTAKTLREMKGQLTRFELDGIKMK